MDKKPVEEQPARILVVDDDEGVRRLVHTILERAGYQVEAVEDALIAQKRLADHDYDVVISDIMMPGISGIELLRLINQKE